MFLRTGNWASSAGYWFNVQNAEWLGITDNPGQHTFLAGYGDPMSTTVTTVITFGDVYPTTERANVALANLAADTSAFGAHGRALLIPFTGTANTHLFGVVTGSWFNAALVTDIYRGSSAGQHAPTLATKSGALFVGTETYTNSHMADAAIERLVGDIHSAYRRQR